MDHMVEAMYWHELASHIPDDGSASEREFWCVCMSNMTQHMDMAESEKENDNGN